MLAVASSDTRIHLAQSLFVVNYRSVSGRVRLTPYGQLLSDSEEPTSSYLCCSVSCFSELQREVAVAWEEAMESQFPGVRIANRPSQVPPWHAQMEDLRDRGCRTAETWTMQSQLNNPRFPVVLRQHEVDFQLESPVIEDEPTQREMVDRLIMEGARPDRLRAVAYDGMSRDGARVDVCSWLRIGERIFASSDSPRTEDRTLMKEVVEASPQEVAAFDFILDESGPILWRIDDELCRVLPHLLPEPSRVTPPGAKIAHMDALLALDRTPDPGNGSLLDIDSSGIRQILMHQ